MSLSFPINHKFLNQLYRTYLVFPQGIKTTNESYFIPRHKLSLGISIQILITNDISQYLKNYKVVNQHNKH